MKEEARTIPVIGPDRPEPEPDVPFTVNRNSANQRALAKLIGWDRIKQIADSEAEAHEKMAEE